VTRADQKSTGSPLLPFAICVVITLVLFVVGILAPGLRSRWLCEVEITALPLVVVALLFAMWLRMRTMIRRYIHERRTAEDELRAARATLESRVEERTREVAASREQVRFLIENIEAIPFEWDAAARRMVYIAPQAAKLLGHPLEALQGAGFVATALPEDERARLAPQVEQFLAGEPGGSMDCRMATATGRAVHVRILLGSRTQGGSTCGVMLDMTRQRQLESELHQARKLESVGRLASGIAHEINTPVQFVTDSVQFVRDSVVDVMAVLDKHRLSTERAAAGEAAVGLARAALAAEADIDLAYLADNVPKALDRALDGLTRVAAIVRSMKVFAHPDSKTKTRIDLNESIASTLTIARNEYKYVAELDTQYGDLPLVACFPGEFNQVVLNLVINAAHAIGDVVTGTEQRGRITVTTRQDGGDAVIAISDTGTGIAPAVQARLFEPFFTTKEIGKGTGQGLSHARAVVVERHGGSLTYETEVGVGTTFTVRLPIDSDTGGEDELAA